MSMNCFIAYLATSAFIGTIRAYSAWPDAPRECERDLPVIWLSSTEEAGRWVPTFRSIGEFKEKIMKADPRLREPIFFELKGWYCCVAWLDKANERSLVTLRHPIKPESMELEAVGGRPISWLDAQGNELKQVFSPGTRPSFVYFPTHQINVKWGNPERIETREYAVSAFVLTLTVPEIPGRKPASLLVKFSVSDKLNQNSNASASMTILLPVIQ